MFSIIVCSHRPERANFIKNHYEKIFHSQDFEFILINDPESLCEGYSRGLAISRGDLIIFSHDDIELIDHNAPFVIKENLRHFDLIGVAGTTKLTSGKWISSGDPYCFFLTVYPENDSGQYEIQYAGDSTSINIQKAQAIDGCFMACQREVAEAIGFDSELFDGFHLYDLDFSFRSYKAGFELAICRNIPLIHLSKGNYNDPAWARYCNIFETKHELKRTIDKEKCNIYAMSSSAQKAHLASICNPVNLLSGWASIKNGQSYFMETLSY